MNATRFSNIGDGVNSHEIAETGDYLIEREGQWYYWIAGSARTANHGPFPTRERALEFYSALRSNFGGKPIPVALLSMNFEELNAYIYASTELE